KLHDGDANFAGVVLPVQVVVGVNRTGNGEGRHLLLGAETGTGGALVGAFGRWQVGIQRPSATAADHVFVIIIERAGGGQIIVMAVGSDPRGGQRGALELGTVDQRVGR